MTYSTLHGWDGKSSSSGNNSNQRQGGSASSASTSYESAQSTPVSVEASGGTLIESTISGQAELLINADAWLTGMTLPVDVISVCSFLFGSTRVIVLTTVSKTSETRLFVPTGLLMDSPSVSRSTARAPTKISRTQDQVGPLYALLHEPPLTPALQAKTTTTMGSVDLNASHIELLQLQERHDELQTNLMLVSIISHSVLLKAKVSITKTSPVLARLRTHI